MKILGMGGLEFVIILLVVLLIFGPKNLPKLGSALGKTVSNLRSGMNEGKKKKKDDAAEDDGSEAGDAGETSSVQPPELEGEVEVSASSSADAAGVDDVVVGAVAGADDDGGADPTEAPKKVKRVVKKKVSAD